MSTVYGARGMHIMAESRPPYSLGLFGHRSNPFLEAFEKATQLCRLINCKSWPSPNYCMKLHRKVSWSPGKPVALKTETNFKTPGQVCCQHISICCILKVWDAALSCTHPALLFLGSHVCLFRPFVTWRQKDNETPYNFCFPTGNGEYY